jgi:hypothetical protein
MKSFDVLAVDFWTVHYSSLLWSCYPSQRTQVRRVTILQTGQGYNGVSLHCGSGSGLPRPKYLPKRTVARI